MTIPSLNTFCTQHIWRCLTLFFSFEQNIRDWKEWYFRPEAENMPLPGEWENKCNELQHMILVRCLRPDRIMSAVSSFIANNLDHKFIDVSFFPSSLLHFCFSASPFSLLLRASRFFLLTHLTAACV